jgi:class 3 adenylate cyclase
VMKQATRFIGTVHAGECLTLNTEIHPIGIQFLDPHRVTVLMPTVDESTTSEQFLKIDLLDDSFEFVNPPASGVLMSGKATIQIENKSVADALLWVRVAPPDAGKHFISFEPFLSGKRLLTTQTFRDLFRTEPIETSEGISVKDITFLFTDLKGSTALYDQVGDTKAYFLVRQHFDTLARVIAQNHGAIVKTIGDAVMATFMTPNEAVKAAIEMIRDIDTFNKGITQDLILKIGVHRGHSIVVALNDRLDYFGQTVNIAARVQGLADANEIFVSEAAFGDPALAEIIVDCDVTSQTTEVKGVSNKLYVHKIVLQ